LLLSIKSTKIHKSRDLTLIAATLN